MRPNTATQTGKKTNVALWIVQSLLAAMFLFAGGAKLVMPAELLAAGPIPLPVEFFRFIGVCEVLGAFGLILPGIFHIRRGLTPLAALGLVIIMVGATTLTAAYGPVLPALGPAAFGSLAALIARARRNWVEPRRSARRQVLQLAR